MMMSGRALIVEGERDVICDARYERTAAQLPAHPLTPTRLAFHFLTTICLAASQSRWHLRQVRSISKVDSRREREGERERGKGKEGMLICHRTRASARAGRRGRKEFARTSGGQKRARASRINHLEHSTGLTGRSTLGRLISRGRRGGAMRCVLLRNPRTRTSQTLYHVSSTVHTPPPLSAPFSPCPEPS